MQKKNFKGRCLKKQLSKCEGVCRTFSVLADAYAEALENNEEIEQIRCNVLMEGLTLGDYTTDFVCKKTNGDLLVRENSLFCFFARSTKETTLLKYPREESLHTRVCVHCRLFLRPFLK